MTISGKNEGNKHEKALGSAGIEVRAVCRAVRHRVEFRGDETLELADAGPFWLAFDQFLASARDFGS
jgi:hypothetical protein